MKVFISWSGNRGKRIAKIFDDYLRQKLRISTFYSPDMKKGQPWMHDLLKNLRDCPVGLVILTSGSVRSPWVAFEAGALVNARLGVDEAPRVCSITFEKMPVPAPFSIFQNTEFNYDETNRLFKDIQETIKSDLTSQQLSRADWEVLEHKVKEALRLESSSVHPDPDALRAYDSTLDDKLYFLANSTYAPAYFCKHDRDYSITLANTSSKLLFGLRVTPARATPLRDLMARVKPTPGPNGDNLGLVNFQSVAENFEAKHGEGAVPPDLDFEDVFLNHIKYGYVHLRRVGIKYKEHGDTKGWVVTFNIHHIDQMGAFRDDHETELYAFWGAQEHYGSRQLVQTRQGTRTVSTEKPTPEATRTTVPNRMQVGVAEERHKRNLTSFTYTIMTTQTKRYGLSDLSYATSRYEEISRFEFVVARDSSDHTLGVFRLEEGHDISDYEGLEESFQRAVKNGEKMVDVGAYIVERGAVRRLAVFQELFLELVRLCNEKDYRNIYIQSNQYDLGFYEKIGFKPIGPTFSLEGWSPVWTPMLLRLADLRDRLSQAQASVPGGIGEDVFWREINRKMRAQS